MASLVKNLLLSACACVLGAVSLPAQEEQKERATLSGSIQADILVPQEDKAIGAQKYDEWALANTYADLRLQSKYVDAGGRFEWNQFPLPGYEADFKGWGLGNFYTRAHWKNGAVTLGDFYEQFGSGFILRTYEERSLGIDNSLRGLHFAWNPFKGIALKVLSGRQRRYWEHNEAWVSGGDVELSLDEWTYLLSRRPHARRLYALAYVCGQYGLILLPDNWQRPKGIYMRTGPKEEGTNAYNAERWKVLEAAGAVFLPAETRRAATQSQGSAEACHYWTSTPHPKQESQALYLLVDQYLPQIKPAPRSQGLSVRLVQDL